MFIQLEKKVIDMIQSRGFVSSLDINPNKNTQTIKHTRSKEV